jgi:diketogulonate reductase-like aldo/keto reductase
MRTGTRQTTAEKIELHSIADRLEVAPGVMMPRFGLGTWRAHGDELVDVVLAALGLGYRLFDTSANYYNEEEVGLAISRSGVPRGEIFLTTKLESIDQGYRSTRPALEASLRRLGMDYVDLYLIHWPDPSKTEETWRALEELQREGLTRSIGISNFGRRDMEQVLHVATVPPAVNQIELNPLEQRRTIHEYCRDHGITVEAWAPVIKGYASRIPELVAIGERHGKTGAQISLRWILQKGMVAIPKTVHEQRLRENADIFDFELSAEEMRAIDNLEGRRHRLGL